MPGPGGVRMGDWVQEVELLINPAIFAVGDLMGNPVEVPYVTMDNGSSVVQSVVVTDYDNAGAALHLVFFDEAPGPLGAPNAAMAITDAQAAMVCGVVPVAATDYSDLGAQQVATVRGVGLEVHPVNGTSLWVAPKSMGTGTYATGRLTVRVGLLRG